MAELETDNPLADGGFGPVHAEPCTLVILGGSGDLSHRKLLPALYNLALDGVLPASFAVLAFARDDWDDARFRAFARDGIEHFSRRALDETHWADFERRLFYHAGSFDAPGDWAQVKQRLEELEPRFGIPANRVYYLAIPPRFIDTCVQQLN